MVDKASEERIAKLHPKVMDEVRDIVKHVNTNVLTGNAKLRIAQGTRTWSEQTELYNQGRTKPGKVVTNAKAGDSIHNYGLAVDMVLIIDGNIASWDTVKDWDKDRKADWMEVVEVFKAKGWSWGGDWKSFKDLPHFEKTFGKSLTDLKRLYSNKQFIPGTSFVKI